MIKQPCGGARSFFVWLCLACSLAPSEALAVLPWGTQIGGYHLTPGAPAVFAFSNGRWEWYPERLSGHGKKWQCVEFVNRFYAEAFGMDIEGGDARYYYQRAASKGLEAFSNGSAASIQPGDVLCSEGPPYGHVAIVRSVEPDGLHIVQQNWFNDARDLNTVLSLSVRDGRTHVGGFGYRHPICGWLRAPAAVRPDRRIMPVDAQPPAATGGRPTARPQA
ncbi:MAG: CHAP domain-containing protein [Pseudomonadota bacterium]